jgi:hypothetical protein
MHGIRIQHRNLVDAGVFRCGREESHGSRGRSRAPEMGTGTPETGM